VRIGSLARGHEFDDVSVNFSIRRLKGKRTFVFARAGYGKSNLTKLLLNRLYQAPPDVGLLIVDPEGEYAFGQLGQDGQRIPGLIDHPSIRDRLLLFTDRKIRHASVCAGLKLDLGKISPDAFIDTFVDPEKHNQVWVNWLRTAKKDAWAQLIKSFSSSQFGVDDATITGLLGIKASPSNVSIAAIRNNVVPVVNALHNEGSTLIDDCSRRLFGFGAEAPGVVILDVSTLPSQSGDRLVRILLQSLFRRAVEDFTRDVSKRGVLLALEEAQTIFGGRKLDDQDIYVRWVKEGRKYGLGAMLITQQPGAIAHEILSQGDNFFVMHLLSQRDLDALGSANAHFTPEIRSFIRDEPVRGNCYFWSAPDQPYVVAARIDNFEKQALPLTEVSPPVEEPRSLLSYEERLLRGVVRALAANPRVYLYAVSRIDDEQATGFVTAAPQYLATWVDEARQLQAIRPDDWQEEWERIALRIEVLERLLVESGLAGAPLRCVGRVQGRDRPMFLLLEQRLREEALHLGVQLRSFREPVALRRR
jgi:hypothetical protein